MFDVISNSEAVALVHGSKSKWKAAKVLGTKAVDKWNGEKPRGRDDVSVVVHYLKER